MFYHISGLPLYIGSAVGIIFGLSGIFACRNPINPKKAKVDRINRVKKPEETVEEYLERYRIAVRSGAKRVLISSFIILCIGLYFDFYKK